MIGDFSERLGHEARITLETLRETVMSIAERVNRKVQILSLHWEAASLQRQQEQIAEDLGNRLFHLAFRGLPDESLDAIAAADADMIVSDTAARLRVVKADLLEVDARIRELEIEALRDDLLKLQDDLAGRSASLRRVVVTQRSSGHGKTLLQLGLPEAVRVVAVFRGPAFLTAPGQVTLRAGDIVVLVGPSVDLKTCLHLFESTDLNTSSFG
jgi:hypothetical protein